LSLSESPQDDIIVDQHSYRTTMFYDPSVNETVGSIWKRLEDFQFQYDSKIPSMLFARVKEDNGLPPVCVVLIKVHTVLIKVHLNVSRLNVLQVQTVLTKVH